MLGAGTGPFCRMAMGSGNARRRLDDISKRYAEAYSTCMNQEDGPALRNRAARRSRECRFTQKRSFDPVSPMSAGAKSGHSSATIEGLAARGLAAP